MTIRIRILTRKNNLSFNRRLGVVPHFSEGIVERAKRERAWKSPHARKGDAVFFSPRCVSPFLAWVDFHVRSRFVRSTIPEEKWGTTRSLIQSRIDKWAKMVSSGIILPFFGVFMDLGQHRDILTSPLVDKANLLNGWIRESCVLIGYPSRQDGTSLLARDLPPWSRKKKVLFFAV